MKNMYNHFRKSLLKVLVIPGIVILTFSCSGFFDLLPENDLIKEDFWRKRSDLEGVMAASYQSFQSATIQNLLHGEIRAKDVRLSGNTEADFRLIGEMNISISNPVVKWEVYYKTINYANTVIHYIPIIMELDASLTPKLAKGIEAEMLFLRSLSYFYLVRLWKEVPLILEPSLSDQDDFFIPKSSEHAIVAQIVSDLKRASALAYTDEFASNLALYKGRANKYSIQALLADVLLWSERYQECIAYCDSIIFSEKDFSLVPYSDWFTLYAPGNSISESLFEIQFDDNIEHQENPINEKLLQVGKPIGDLRTDSRLLALFDQTDIRRGLLLPPVANPTIKYTYINNSNQGTQRTGGQRDANFIIYRYADILLMKAEALAELGDMTNFDAANNLISQVSQRAGISSTPVFTRNELRITILNERRREFAIEGKSWFDLLRFSKKNKFENKQLLIDVLLTGDIKRDVILRALLTDTMSYYLPIHIDEIRANPMLVQNPFYTR